MTKIDNEQNAVTAAHIAHQNHVFLVKKVKFKTTKKISKNIVSLELLNKRLGHRFTSSPLAGDTEIFW